MRIVIWSLCLLLIGCAIGYNKNAYSWRGVPSEDGFIVGFLCWEPPELWRPEAPGREFSTRWEVEARQRAISVLQKYFKQHDSRLDTCAIIGKPVLNQGGYVDLVAVVGNATFVKHWETMEPKLAGLLLSSHERDAGVIEEKSND
ncbi:MAG: hypothetical protein ACHQ5A_08275 [Opitutales bacterium]